MADKLVRLNIRVSKENNNFLDRKSAETGISKSALVQIAVEYYRQQEEALSAMKSMEQLTDKLNDIQEEIKELKNK